VPERLRIAPGGHETRMAPPERRDENQMRFRKANERLLAAVEDSGRELRRVPFLCECADGNCLGTVDVEISEWEAVASRPNHFLILPGHERSEGEEVIASVREYEIARKPR
jgi:hypothetical protein